MLPHNYYGNLGQEAFEKLPTVLQRFLSYTQYDTTSQHDSPLTPSTPAQVEFGKLLAEEFKSVGLQDVKINHGGIVLGFMPATEGYEDYPAMGLIAHMDTSPEASGADIKWQLIDYKGGDILLNEEKAISMTMERFPGVAKYAGQQLVVTDGTTLLGGDDKAGVAIILEAANFYRQHPEIPHAKICFAVTPDEEVSRGTENFDIEEFGAQYAYTLDGDEEGSFETETFSAAMVDVYFEGLNTHPGSAKDKMVNAIRIAMDFLSRLPSEAVPEKTENYEGFFHPLAIEGAVRGVKMRMLIRDHDRRRYEDRKEYVLKMVEEMNKVWGDRVKVNIKHQYYNMGDFLKDSPAVCELPREAYRRCGVEIHEKPVRGGTDGARLSARGLPTPNLFTGGMNYHGVFECLSVSGLLKSTEVVQELIKMTSETKSLK